MPKGLFGKRDVYIEVAEKYENYIRLSVLRDGNKLPSVRTAAAELGINSNTVQKAYVLLEEKCLICSLPQKGAFVTLKKLKAIPFRERLFYRKRYLLLFINMIQFVKKDSLRRQFRV